MSDSNGKPVRPRTQPRQLRAQTTVDAILIAAEQIITKHGYENATTNRIAELAGVSIGSLYQYFPNKEAVAVALVERIVSRESDRLRDVVISVMQAPVSEAMPKIIRELVRVAQEKEFSLVRELQLLPQLRDDLGRVSTHNFTHTIGLAYLTGHKHETTVEDPAVAFFIIQNAINGNIQRYVDEGTDQIDEDTLVEHVSKLVLNYLTR